MILRLVSFSPFLPLLSLRTRDKSYCTYDLLSLIVSSIPFLALSPRVFTCFFRAESIFLTSFVSSSCLWLRVNELLKFSPEVFRSAYFFTESGYGY